MIAEPIHYRDYQQRAVDSVWSHWNAGVRSTLVVAATGVGKGVICPGVADRMPEDSRFMYIVHREALANQAVKQFRKFTNRTVAVEMKAHGIGRTHSGNAQIVVASVHSLRARRGKYRRDAFDFVGTDESDRFAGNTWAEIVRHFDAKHRIGFTATPHRHDGVQLIGEGCEFDSMAFCYPIEQGVQDGWIVPFRWRIERCRDIDLESIERTGTGDLSPSHVEREMSKDAVVTFMCRQMIHVAEGKQGILFCTGVNQAHAAAREFVKQGATAVAITGDTPEFIRDYLDRDFKSNRAQFICVCEMHVEGYDHPGIAVVGMGKLTCSWRKYAQMGGRGSRTMGEPVGDTPEERRAWVASSEKPYCTILDFVGNSTRHDLMFGVHLMGGEFTRAEVEEAVRLVSDQGSAFDLDEVAADARKNVAARPKMMTGGEFKFNDTAEERRFTYNHRADPFEILQLDKSAPHKVVPEEETYGAGWRAAWEFLVESKIPQDDIGNLCQYSVVYLRDELMRRAREGLCTFPQASKLYNLGYDCGDMTYREAKQKIIAARAINWLRPVTDGPNERFLNR